MNSKDGCPQISTANYFFFLKSLNYPLAVIGILTGLITCIAGRLFLSFLVYILNPSAFLAIGCCLSYSIMNDPESKPYINWAIFLTTAILGILLTWALKRNKVL